MPDKFHSSHLIDSTSMANIQSYLHKKFVTGIIHVKDADLGYVGDLCLRADPGNVEFFQSLLTEKKIEVWNTNEQVTIPSINKVDVIIAKPYYIVKDRKERYK